MDLKISREQETDGNRNYLEFIKIAIKIIIL
jgi:hypothetical protein